MRSGLRLLEGKRIRVICRLERNDYVMNDRRAVVLNVFDYETGELYADHIWLNWKDDLSVANPKEGDVLAFSGIVKFYLRTNLAWDYGFCKVTEIEINPKHPRHATWEVRARNKGRNKVTVKKKEKRSFSKVRGTPLMDFGVYGEKED